MENENILLISCIIHDENQEEGFPIPIQYIIDIRMPIRSHKEYTRMYKDFLIIYCHRTIRINVFDYLYNLYNKIVEINGIPYNVQWEG